MHLLYVDESGSVSDPAQQYFVLVGVSIFERRTHWIEQNLNEIAKQLNNYPIGLIYSLSVGITNIMILKEE